MLCHSVANGQQMGASCCNSTHFCFSSTTKAGTKTTSQLMVVDIVSLAAARLRNQEGTK
jgi:nitrate reductase cytochrome c-type subunit